MRKYRAFTADGVYAGCGIARVSVRGKMIRARGVEDDEDDVRFGVLRLPCHSVTREGKKSAQTDANKGNAESEKVFYSILYEIMRRRRLGSDMKASSKGVPPLTGTLLARY